MPRDRRSDRHRVIGSAKEGRKLNPNEVVHHVNEDKNDNHPDNLETKDRGTHTSRHNRTRTAARIRKVMSGETEKLY
jgi:hypothetical protein